MVRPWTQLDACTNQLSSAGINVLSDAEQVQVLSILQFGGKMVCSWAQL